MTYSCRVIFLFQQFGIRMKKWFPIVFAALVITTINNACESKNNAQDQIYERYRKDIDSMILLVNDKLIPSIQQHDALAIRENFMALRYRYKTLEAGIEYFMPGTAKGINGAPLPEVELEGNTEMPPTGLQVMEPYIFPLYDTLTRQQLLLEAGGLRSMLLRAKQIWAVQKTTAAQWYDAIYYQMIRIAAMGITGFDTPGSQTGIVEAFIAMQCLGDDLALLLHNQQDNDLIAAIINAENYLQQHHDFEKFDRAVFLKQYWQPAFAKLVPIRESHLPSTARLAMNKQSKTLFGNDVFNLSFFSPDTLGTSEPLALLGEKLFYDNRLSRDGKFSCASCHAPDKYFSDNKALSDNIHGTPLSRNTPTLMNTALQTNFFWDMRAQNLELQAKAVVDNQFEMHGSLKEVCKLLQQDNTLQQEVNKVFGTTDAISELHVMRALAAYQRTLIGYNSKFDAYMNGDEQSVSDDAIAGFNLFMGKAKCATCHFMPTFGGLVPPYFNKMESEVLGTPSTTRNNILDNDEGRGELYPAESYKHAFKTPSIRNIAATYPYMHNGVYSTLEEVVDFYNKGGGEGLGYVVPNQTLPFDSLKLTALEQKQIVAFMQSLTDKPFAAKEKRSAL